MFCSVPYRTALLDTLNLSISVTHEFTQNHGRRTNREGQREKESGVRVHDAGELFCFRTAQNRYLLADLRLNHSDNTLTERMEEGVLMIISFSSLNEAMSSNRLIL